MSTLLLLYTVMNRVSNQPKTSKSLARNGKENISSIILTFFVFCFCWAEKEKVTIWKINFPILCGTYMHLLGTLRCTTIMKKLLTSTFIISKFDCAANQAKSQIVLIFNFNKFLFPKGNSLVKVVQTKATIFSDN